MNNNSSIIAHLLLLAFVQETLGQAPYQLNPLQKELAVSTKTEIEIPESTGNTANNGNAIFHKKDSIAWFANEIRNGDSTVGTISSLEIPQGEGKIYKTEFTAPYYMPRKNPVIITAIIYRFSGNASSGNLPETLKTELIIFDEYRITVSQKGRSILDCRAELRDSGSFVARLYPKRTVIQNVKNEPLVLTKQSNCIHKYNTNGATGPVDLKSGKLTGYEISDAFPPMIHIEFVPAALTIMKCEGKYPEEKHDALCDAIGVSVGNTIRFAANGIFQSYYVHEEQGEDHTITITRIRYETLRTGSN